MVPAAGVPDLGRSTPGHENPLELVRGPGAGVAIRRHVATAHRPTHSH